MELRVTIHPHLLKPIKHFIPKICIATSILDVLLLCNDNFRKRNDQCRFIFSFISFSLYLYFLFFITSHYIIYHIYHFSLYFIFLFLSSIRSYTLKWASVILFPFRTIPGNSAIQGKKTEKQDVKKTWLMKTPLE